MSPRARRFLAEFVAATVLAAVLSRWLLVLVQQPDSISGNPLAWLPPIAAGVAQWLVLRRYVPWAEWWALATMAGDAFSKIVPLNTVINVAHDAAGWESQTTLTVVAVVTAVLTAIFQLPTLAGRVKRSPLWLFAPPMAYEFARLATPLMAPLRPRGPGMMSVLVFVANRTLAEAIVLGIALAWLCRPWLNEEPSPPARPHSRLEFLIAWMVVPAIALDAAFTGLRGLLLILPLAFLLVLAAGQLWVIAGTGLDLSRWRLMTLSTAIGFGALSTFDNPFSYLYVYQYGIHSGGTALGLLTAIGQLFALKGWTSRIAWLPVSLIAWASGLWIPQLVHSLAGPAESWRYPVSNQLLGILAGLLTGLVLLVEPGLIRRPAPTNRIS